MSCCGGQRLGITHPVRHEGPNMRAMPSIEFVYIGRSSLTVIGGASGRAYHFAHPGCALAVEARDAAGVAGMPVLRRGA